MLDDLYLAGDTVWYEGVEETIARHEPRVAVVNAGGAEFEQGGLIIMGVDDVREVAARVPTVVAVHLEALNHCYLTRAALRAELPDVLVPDDGTALELGRRSASARAGLPPRAASRRRGRAFPPRTGRTNGRAALHPSGVRDDEQVAATSHEDETIGTPYRPRSSQRRQRGLPSGATRRRCRADATLPSAWPPVLTGTSRSSGKTQASALAGSRRRVEMTSGRRRRAVRRPTR